eukprot:IDg9656t1
MFCFAVPLNGLSLSIRTASIFGAKIVGSTCRQLPGSRTLGTHASVSLNRKPAAARAPPKQSNDIINKYVSNGTGVVVLKRGKARYFREGRSIMVFSGAVASVVPPKGGTLSGADPVVVMDGAQGVIGYGFYNPESMFRVRLLRHGAMGSADVDVARDIERHVLNAFTLRTSLGLPNEQTTAFRAINGEGDRLSGLVVDVYGDVLVVSSSALWVERYREDIEQALRAAVPNISWIVWRKSSTRLRQDGYVVAAANTENIAEDNATNDTEIGTEITKSNNTGNTGNDLVALENDVRFSMPDIALTTGQKTGHYTDQRDARQFLRQMLTARGGRARVLDLFSYSGGFALNAALAGADVTCVDSSEAALALASTNAELNGVSERMQVVRSDVSKYLDALSEDEEFDVVICDPPKLAPNANALQKATRKYRGLNAAALRRVRHGGLLITCSCSAAVARKGDLFIETIRQAATDAKCDVALLKKFGSAADHPVHPESLDGDYLNVCLFACTKWDAGSKEGA